MNLRRSDKKLAENTVAEIQRLLLEINPYASVLEHASEKLKADEGNVCELQVKITYKQLHSE